MEKKPKVRCPRCDHHEDDKIDDSRYFFTTDDANLCNGDSDEGEDDGMVNIMLMAKLMVPRVAVQEEN